MSNADRPKPPIIRIAQATAKGYVEVWPGMVFDFAYPSSKLRRGRLQGNGEICPTITKVHGGLLLYESYAGQKHFPRNVDTPDGEEDGVLHQPDK